MIELRGRFPARANAGSWAGTLRSSSEILDVLNQPPYRHSYKDRHRVRGAENLMGWLGTFPGISWQERWQASDVESARGRAWMDHPVSWLASRNQTAAHDRTDLAAGMLALICADAIRPGLRWIFEHGSTHLTSAMERYRDREGITRMREALADRAVRPALSGRALHKVSVILANRGGLLADITVGDCVEVVDVQGTVQRQTYAASLFYEVLHGLGQFPADAPATIRPFRSARGQLTIDQLVDRYRIACTPVRDLLVDYLKERQPALDYSTLRHLARVLASYFWRDLELHHPGIDHLRLSTQAARAWKDRARYKTTTVTLPDGSVHEAKAPRTNYKSKI
ncbi:hypothetical protein ACIQWZ_36370 [Streptomyces sp. NPDC098077]|uniref:hypothetical protein n=1 Tax=Streptomyces sp. NPDC098077 TaxID=3366093 RepID=UPI00382FDA22